MAMVAGDYWHSGRAVKSDHQVCKNGIAPFSVTLIWVRVDTADELARFFSEYGQFVSRVFPKIGRDSHVRNQAKCLAIPFPESYNLTVGRRDLIAA
jgi:hypothetical protein